MQNNRSGYQSLANKTVVITGASSGVGLATAEAFAVAGCNLVLASRGRLALDKAVDICRGLGANAIGIPTDVSEYVQVKELAAQALQQTGKIDFWVNNAGVMASGKFEEIPIEVSHQVLKTNLFGYLNGAYAVFPIFKVQGHGVLINNVSIGGFMPAPYSAVYSATKFGIKGMMECLRGRSRMKSTFISVTCIHRSSDQLGTCTLQSIPDLTLRSHPLQPIRKIPRRLC